ncbi:MAG: exported protein of unknown function [Candidatus Saccharibacteria bacterium]|nr:exported protein of unknown function [Candidatus Saccharibacteria bacterium]
MKNIKLRELLSSRLRPIVAGVAGLIALAVVLSVSLQAQAAVGINKTVNFQGKVVNLNGTNVADASYSFRFRIYTAATGDTGVSCTGGCKWEETKSLTTVNGIFQTNLGSVTPFTSAVDFNSDSLYVGVLFNGDSEMTPRIRLTAVPYAFNADKLGGLDSSAFAQLSPGAQQTGFLNVSGNITSGGIMFANTLDSASAGVLNVGSLNTTGINLNQSTTIAFAKSLTFTGGASNFDQSASTGTFKTGTGAIALNGDTTIAASKTFTANGISLIKTDASNAFQVQGTGGYNILGVDTNSGRVGIATGSTAPAYTLDVNGDTGISGNLYMGYGTTRTITVASNPGGVGNTLALKGGDAGSGNSNGGNIQLTGGLGSGTGARGIVLLDTPAFTTTSNDGNCFTGGNMVNASCTISAVSVNNTSAIIVGFTSSANNPTATLPDPANTTPGRILYVTGANGTKDFTLIVNGGGVGNQIAMRQNTSATMIWNGADWTAAGASSSTTLQAAYDNTLASAGGAEIILNNTATSNGLTIRNAQTNPVTGSVFEVQSSIGTNYLSVNSNAIEYVTNGGAESNNTYSSEWVSIGAGTVNRYTTTTTNIATGQASTEVNTAAAIGAGVRVKIAPALSTTPTQYQVSFTGRAVTGFSGLSVSYTPDGGSTVIPCSSYSTQALTNTGWSKVTCVFTTTSAAAGSPFLQITQSDATARTFYVDNASVTQSTITSAPPNVQIGGGSFGGTVTLFTLDKSSSPPVAAGNDVYYGSMYYDTTSGRIQCYQANGWGACGSAPDTFVNLTPEYAGAVLNGTGVGTMTADFCSNQSSVLAVNTALCGTGQALNFYKWTSPQATQQTYSIYIAYQLPGGFKSFQSNSTVQLTARTDNTTTGSVTYEMFRSQAGAVTACGTETTITTAVNTWQTVGINGNESDGCGFNSASANNFAIFKINVKARSNANVYVGALSFTIVNQ